MNCISCGGALPPTTSSWVIATSRRALPLFVSIIILFVALLAKQEKATPDAGG
jgi:hypothetical protein